MAHPPFHAFFRLEYSDFNGQSTRGKMERWFFFNIPEISAQIQKPTNTSLVLLMNTSYSFFLLHLLNEVYLKGRVWLRKLER